MNAKANDDLRKQIPFISLPNLLVITRGIAGMGELALAEILQKVKDFNNFNYDNDPWHHHDFGSFLHDGEKVYWKIDNYNGQDGYNLVLTILLAQEY